MTPNEVRAKLREAQRNRGARDQGGLPGGGATSVETRRPFGMHKMYSKGARKATLCRETASAHVPRESFDVAVSPGARQAGCVGFSSVETLRGSSPLLCPSKCKANDRPEGARGGCSTSQMWSCLGRELNPVLSGTLRTGCSSEFSGRPSNHGDFLGDREGSSHHLRCASRC